MENKLDFVIIGGQKCGTTALSDYLSRHPDINFCTLKETGYFSNKGRIGIKNLDDYFSLYKDVQGLKGEASPSYAFPKYLPHTAKNLKDHFPDIKVILIVRNPVKRIESNINHNVLHGKDIGNSIEEYLNNHPQIIEKSKFGHIVKTYRSIFQENRFLAVKFEDLTENRVFDQLSDFLQINYLPKLKLREANKTNKRYVTLPIWKFYKNNWKRVNMIPFPRGLRRGIKSTVDRLFSKKLNQKEKIKISPEVASHIESILKEDDRIFKEFYDFSYFSLSK